MTKEKLNLGVSDSQILRGKESGDGVSTICWNQEMLPFPEDVVRLLEEFE